MESISRTKQNAFIQSSFRDVADSDYIAARACYWYDLLDQFLWFACQAMEKYLKAIILYNDGDTRHIRHDLTKAIRQVERITIVSWDFADELKAFLGELNELGPDRYFVRPRWTRGKELLRLDRAVWEVRRYCDDLRSVREEGADRLEEYVRYVQSEECRRKANRFRLLSKGHLEAVLDTDRFPAQRKLLIWKNFYYGSRKKRTFRFLRKLSGKVPEHYFSPELYPWVKERVYLPEDVKRYFENYKENLPQASQTAGALSNKGGNLVIELRVPNPSTKRPL